MYVDNDKLYITEQGCNNAARIDVILSHKLPFAEIRVFFRWRWFIVPFCSETVED